MPLKNKRPTDLSLAKVHRACVQLREKAYERANAALTSQRFRGFLIDVAEWIETGTEQRRARPRLKGEPSAKELVSKALSRMLRKMKVVSRIDELGPRRLHKLRLRAKRLRYTIEFTSGLYDANPKRVEGMLRQLGKLQSTLGELNDMASARTILNRIAVEAKAHRKSVKPRITSGLTGVVPEIKKGRKSNQLKKAAKAFEKLEDLKPFWT